MESAHHRPSPTPMLWLGAWWPRIRPWLLTAAGVLLCLLMAKALHGFLNAVRYDEVMKAVTATSDLNIALAVLATALSYVILAGYDFSALTYAHAKVPRPTVFVTSFVAYALSNTIGLGPLTGGAIRTRMYAATGLTPHQIAQIIVFNLVAFGIGITAFGALGLLWGAADVAPLLHLPAVLLQLAAVAALAALGAFVWLCSRRRVLSIGPRWTLRLPTTGLAMRQLLISAVELAASAAALWFLLPDGQIPLPTFIVFYAIAIAAGIVSHVPGGVGVFEAVMLVATQQHVGTDAMLGALLLNRGIYYVLPLVVATAMIVAYELRSGVAAPVGRAAVRLAPRLLAALAVVAGVWLLVSGVTPLTEDAKDLLAALNVPLPLIEASHFLGSVAGLGFLLVARGLFHRLDAAWWAATALAVVSAVLALPKGIALNEAALLSALAVLLLVSRRQFDRPSSLFAQRLEPGWLVTLAVVLVACTWLLVFAYHEVRYTNRLWWQFELDAEAPRSLRALLAVELAALAFGLWQLFRPTAGSPLAPPTAEEIDRAAAIVRANPFSEGCYALTGDKHLMFSPSGNSFLMFGRHGRSWISLFGPVGDRREWADLVWRFVELASSHGGRPAFYQVRPASLPLYLDCGLHAFKLGEYAQIDLADFNLKGAKRANLRSGMNRGEREGLQFEVLAPAQVDAVMPQLRAVSDAWLDRQTAREKGFSVGRFDERYLSRLPVAVVRRDGVIIAFASLQMTDAAQDAGVDLMRHSPDAPPGTMDFMFAKVLLHMQGAGFRQFGLGMSPMAGMATRRRAPRWQRLGRLLFQHGERFYSFRGLYNYKDKFEPTWEARYLAAPGGISPLLVLADVAALIGDGGRRESPRSSTSRKLARAIGIGALCSVSLFGPRLGQAQAAPPTAASATATASVISHGQFDRILVLRPAGKVEQFVMLFTGGEAPAPSDRKLADAMAARGAMVALVPLDPFYRRLVANSEISRCVYGGGSVDNFARHVQAQDRMQTYIEPILVGTGTAAAFPYVLLTQSPADNFTGALSVGFCPRMSLPMTLCTANEFKSRTAADKSIEFEPAARLVAPWSATPPASPAACPATSTAASPAAFVKAVPGAGWIAPSPANATDEVPAGFLAAYDRLASQRAALGAPPEQLSDLPVVEVPAKTPGKRFAVLISGDGGWASIDKALAAALAKDGVPVVGVDSLRYFWKARTPEGLTADMDRVIRYYAARWQRSEVVFIGFSQGADVLPFVYNRLPQRTKDSIKLNVLLAPGQKAAFEFHVANWLGKSGDKPILPEAVRLKAANTVCFYGTDEKADALCPLLDASQTRTVAMPGGHHLGGDYDALAAQMLGFLPR